MLVDYDAAAVAGFVLLDSCGVFLLAMLCYESERVFYDFVPPSPRASV